MDIIVRPMTFSDLQSVIDLALGERWFLLREDLEASIEWNPTACLLAENKGKLVGFVTSFLSDGVGWWGNLLINPDFRRQGMGQLLIRRVIDELDSRQARSQILVASHSRVELYRMFDFKPFQELVIWVGRSREEHDPGAIASGKGDIDLAVELDKQAWGFSRSLLLNHLALRRELLSVSSPHSFLMYEPVKTFQFIGPWEAVDGGKKAAGELLKKLFRRLGLGASVFLKSPAENYLAAQLLTENGFTPVETETMMYRGEVPTPDFNKIFAIATGGSSG